MPRSFALHAKAAIVRAHLRLHVGDVNVVVGALEKSCNASGSAATLMLMECRAALVIPIDSPVQSENESAVCQKYASRIQAYGLRHLRDRSRAQDLVQYVLLSVLQALRAGRIEDLQRLDAYVLGTCRNAVQDIRRGEARQRRVGEESVVGLPEGYEPVSLQVDRAQLNQCLFRLEARARAIILATFLEDRDADEIGQTLDLTPGNVRVIRHRALAQLQACIEGAS